jgi:isoaspartyl peptidase/L-asparaginase-like protein (Ntn-hydrolase superfamily)
MKAVPHQTLMEKTPHIYLALDGAEALAKKQVPTLIPFYCSISS